MPLSAERQLLLKTTNMFVTHRKVSKKKKNPEVTVYRAHGLRCEAANDSRYASHFIHDKVMHPHTPYRHCKGEILASVLCIDVF